MDALEPLYLDNAIVTDEGSPTQLFLLRWQSLITRSQLAAAKVTKAITGLHDALPVTTLLTVVAAGYYRASYYVRKTIADGAGSSAQVTFSWTDLGAACSHTFAALLTDTAVANDSDDYLMRVDANSDITITVAYGSTTPNVMGYDVIGAVEQVS